MGSIWDDYDEKCVTNEASVEHYFVSPLLESLGYDREDIAPKHPVIRRQGRGRKPEADFVVFDGPEKSKNTSLITVEAKAPGELLEDAKEQGESYAQAIGTPFLLVTNGLQLEIWQLQLTAESKCIFKCSTRNLSEHRGSIELILAKDAAIAFCKTLHSKNALRFALDFSAYLTNEIERGAETLYSHQRSLCVTTRPDTIFSAGQLLDSFPKGGVISGASGFGKTTLAAYVLRLSIEECLNDQTAPLPCHIQLPDLAVSKQSIATYAHARISAHCPALSETKLYELAREQGLKLICDGFDRLIDEHANMISASLRDFIRDFPLVQIFIFTRPGAIPDLSIPELSLQPLSNDEQQSLLEAGAITKTEACHILNCMPKSLHRLAPHPLLLSRIGLYWQSHRSYPARLEELFEAWLTQLLVRGKRPLSYLVTLRHSLNMLADATVKSPISLTQALTLLEKHDIPVGILDDLVSRDAVRISGMTIELHHETLADYLRAHHIASSESRFEAFLGKALAPNDSLFPVLLMALLPTRQHQKMLWEKLSHTSLSTYLEAIRYRANAVVDFDHDDTGIVAQAFLTDMQTAINELSRGFFPQLRSAIVEHLTYGEPGDLEISGELTEDRQWISYHFRGSSEKNKHNRPRGGEHGASLRGLNIRIDSGRLLGAKTLLECLIDMVKTRDLKGRETWITERLTGRIRVLEKFYWGGKAREYQLENIESMLAPQAGSVVQPERNGPRFTVQSVLDDIQWLLHQGRKTLVPWWLDFVEAESLRPPSDFHHQRLIEEYFRRTQLMYAEICEENFKGLLNELGNYRALPVRYQVFLKPIRERVWMDYRWRPVENWEMAGADVSTIDTRVFDFNEIDYKELEFELKKHGRYKGGALRPGGSTSLLPSVRGYMSTGRFTGETSVIEEVCEWVADDLKKLFQSLPSRDSD